MASFTLTPSVLISAKLALIKTEGVNHLSDTLRCTAHQDKTQLLHG